MSSTVCQGLQSCLVEPPRALRLKLTPAAPNPSPATNDDDSAWLRNCFFQSPSDTSSSFYGKACPEYVHPLTKRRLSMLSEKSLEMCTESLGSETGTHVGDYDVSPAAVRVKETKPRTKKLNRAQSFPPPLTSTGVQVRSRREGGRLVVAVTAAAEWKSVFHVERSEGRIRVEMVRDTEETSLDVEEVEEEEIVGDGEVAEVDDGGMAVVSGEGEDMDGNIGIVEGDLGTEKFGRPRRCMESRRRSNQSLLKQNWEPCLVTI